MVAREAYRLGISRSLRSSVASPWWICFRRNTRGAALFRLPISGLGDGPLDLVFVPPHVSNVELVWEIPSRAAGVRRLAEFSRVITFDKRGTGLSDRMSGVPSLEERMDDVRAMMDAVGSSRAAILGVLEGGPMSVLFAASFRIDALARSLLDVRTCGVGARPLVAPDSAGA